MQLMLKCKIREDWTILIETNTEANQNQVSTLVTSATTAEPQYLKVSMTIDQIKKYYLFNSMQKISSIHWFLLEIK